MASPWEDVPDWSPSAAPAPTGAPSSGGNSDAPYIDPATGRLHITVRPNSRNAWDDVPDWTPPAAKTDERREVGTGEAAVRGAVDAASFGLAPALTGLQEAGKATKEGKQAEESMAGVASEAPGLEGTGAALAHMFGQHADPEVRAAYERGRQRALDDEHAAREQHPYAFFGGQLAGSLATPGFGAASAGTLPARLITGAAAGGVGAGLYGTGEAVSEGKSLPQAAEAGVESAPFGAVTGGILKGAIGPRVGRAAATPGERAAQTAAELGAPLPKGVTSDRPAVQATTAKLQSVPFAGEKISKRVKATGEASGERISDIANEKSQGAKDRAVADAFIRPGLQDVIENNKQAADQAYGAVRSSIDRNAHFTMPHTDAALNEIMRARAAAGHPNPAQGLEQFRNVAGGATFEGAHRARVDARDAGNALVPHPGYNAADYNRLTRAMTADLREMVKNGAILKQRNPQKAVAAFDQAEHQFGKIAEQNKLLHKLANAANEGAIGSLMSAAKEKGGNLRLLAQLRHSMAPEDFELIGGQLLHELGGKGDTFSLAKFATEWSKLSEGSKRVLFSPEHLKNINDIVDMGKHIKTSLEQTNRSHTTGALLAFDAIRAVVEGGIALGAGVVDPVSGTIAATSFVGTRLLTRYLASPSKAAAMARFSRTYGAASQNPTPARIAAFKVATRNMANTLGLDPAAVTRQIEHSVAGESETGQSQPDERQKK